MREDSSVSNVTGTKLNNWSLITGMVLLFTTTSTRALEPTQPPTQ